MGLYIIHQILIQHILVFSFLLEKSIMDGVYVIFILVEHHLSFFFYFYILEELCFMVHTIIIQILGFQEFFFFMAIAFMFHSLDRCSIPSREVSILCSYLDI